MSDPSSRHTAHQERGTTVQSVIRALAVLEALAAAGAPVSLTELSHSLKLHASTTHRLLSTLKACGFAIQDPETSLYALGPKVLSLSRQESHNATLRILARPELIWLAEQTYETANLVVRDRLTGVYIDQVPSPHYMMRMFTRPGAEAPLHCTGVGKVLLAYMPEHEVHQLIARIGMPVYTPNTKTDVESLLADLEQVRAAGVAYDREEREIGVECVACPVFDDQGRVVAAVSISGPSSRMAHRLANDLTTWTRQAANRISARLGYPAPEE